MSKVVFFIIVMLLLAGGLVATCFAQQGPNMFGSYTDAKIAYETGSFSYYQPKYFDNHKVNPVNNQNKIAAPLQEDAILELMTTNGRQFVIQPTGTIMRWEKNVPYARDDCGNQVFSYYPINSSVAEVVTENSLAFKPEFIKGEKGDKGDNGRDGKDGQVPPITIVVDNGFPWATLIVATLTGVVGVLAYLVVDRYYDNLQKDDPAVIPPGVDTGGVYKKLEPNRGFVLVFSSSF